MTQLRFTSYCAANVPLRPILTSIGKTIVTTKSLKCNVFVNKIKQKFVSTGYKLVSFDVKFLYRNVSLDKKIDAALKRMYI